MMIKQKEELNYFHNHSLKVLARCGEKEADRVPGLAFLPTLRID
jgi:hypothetical protein